MRRMTVRGWKVLTDSGLTMAQARQALAALRFDFTDFCVVSGYRRKGPTGTGSGGKLMPLDLISEVAANAQRDGDGGDTELRIKHAETIVRSLFKITGGLTDEELKDLTGIFGDSCKGARAGLVKGGWIQPRGDEKRLSQNNRPMQVWELTTGARESLANPTPVS